MLMAEAQWIGRTLGQLDAEDLSPLLNVGSATATFREVVQPWIDREIVAPLVKRGVAIHHLDIQEGDGIDLHGDLTDDTFVAGLGSYGFRSLLCCNLLEHVPTPPAICAKLELLVPVGGYLFITVPNRFPYHPDPIDTMFRPEVPDIARLFPHCRLICGDVIDCGTGWDYVDRNPITLFASVRRRLAGLGEHGGVKGSASFFPWLFRRFRQSCTLLQRCQ
jgi:hypothetical protein